MPKGCYQHKKGEQITEEIRKKLSESAKKRDRATRIKSVGINNYQWKETGAGMSSIHHWVRRWKGKPNKCDNCGTENAKKYEWCNIDHKYRRVLEDYIRMCTKCHRKYDIENNIYNNWNKRKRKKGKFI